MSRPPSAYGQFDLIAGDGVSHRCAKQVTQATGTGKGATTCTLVVASTDQLAGGEDGADLVATCSIKLAMQRLSGTTCVVLPKPTEQRRMGVPSRSSTSIVQAVDLLAFDACLECDCDVGERYRSPEVAMTGHCPQPRGRSAKRLVR